MFSYLFLDNGVSVVVAESGSLAVFTVIQPEMSLLRVGNDQPTGTASCCPFIVLFLILSDLVHVTGQHIGGTMQALRQNGISSIGIIQS